MSIERLSGGLTPADGSDPRTFPEIFNGFADEFEGKNIPAFGTAAPSDGDALVYNDAEDLYEPGSVAVSDATPTVAGVVKGTTSDGSNTALGENALQSVTTANSNVAVGVDALKDNTISDLTAVGFQALKSNTTGGENTAVGYKALLNNLTGSENTAFGSFALTANTNGIRNSAFGDTALFSNTTGATNMAIGRNALRNNETGDANVAVGLNALILSLGSNNTAIGQSAGLPLETGDNNMMLGFQADPSSNSVSNEITLGNSSITSLRCNQTSISSLSDVRDKTDIVDTRHGLDTLKKMRPVDFTWARRDGSFGSAPDIGFIAQELASVEDETGDAHRLRLTLRNNPEKLEATPGRLIPILVKAVQELSAKNDELEARIEALEAQ